MASVAGGAAGEPDDLQPDAGVTGRGHRDRRYAEHTEWNAPLKQGCSQLCRVAVQACGSDARGGGEQGIEVLGASQPLEDVVSELLSGP